jgi:rhodanese-related sulfurtransferase
MVIPVEHTSWVRERLAANWEIALIDVREEAVYAEGHPLFAACLPFSQIEQEVFERIPRLDVPVVVYDNGEGLVERAAKRLQALGYTNIATLKDGLAGWQTSGREIFRDVNTPSKAFVQWIKAQDAPAISSPEAARELADRAGVTRISADQLQAVLRDVSRTTYRFDVRTPEEYEAGHLSGFRLAPELRLVQETDLFVPVRGGRIVLADDTGVRANTIALRMMQMNWDVYVLDEDVRQIANEIGPWRPRRPPLRRVPIISAAELASQLGRSTVVLDLSSSAAYASGHIPSASFALRSELPKGIAPKAELVVFTSPKGALARYAVEDYVGMNDRVYALDGGNDAWVQAGFKLVKEPAHYISPPLDRYRPLHENSDDPSAAALEYREWEAGLVAQLERDGTHGFHI